MFDLTKTAVLSRIVLLMCPLLVCLGAILRFAGRPESWRRLERVLKAPVVWVIFYQLIVAYHSISDGEYWNPAWRCGIWLILVGGMAIGPPMAADRYACKIGSLFRGLIWLSIITAVLNPTAAFYSDQFYHSFLPFAKFAGIAGNPNQFGPLAAVAVLLELHNLRSHKRWSNWTLFYLVVSIVGLVLTQSKASWIACVLSGSYFFGATRAKRYSPLGKGFLGVSVACAVGVVGWYTMSNWVTENANSIVTLTGRTNFWAVLWDIGWERPWFGYGPGWGLALLDAAPKYKAAAGDAHNQLLNSFLTTGLAGIVCWFLYVIALIRCARGVCGSIRSLYIGILLVILIRCFVESGLEPGGYSLTQQMQTILIGFGFCKTYASVPAITQCRRPWARAERRPALALRSASVWKSAI